MRTRALVAFAWGAVSHNLAQNAGGAFDANSQVTLQQATEKADCLINTFKVTFNMTLLRTSGYRWCPRCFSLRYNSR